MKMHTNIDLGVLLTEHRQRRGLSLAAASKLIGIANGYLSELETGKMRNPALGVVQKLSKGYGIKAGVWLRVTTTKA